MRNVQYAIYLLVFLRTYLVGAAFNMRGLQNVGFMFAMDPGLTAIHRDPASLRKARGRYARHYNCHQFWTPLVAGMLLNVEDQIAKGRMAPETFTAIKDTAVNTLSALGDSVFGGTLLVTWGLSMTSLILADHGVTALAVSITLFLALQLFKLVIFIAGLRYGLGALFWLRRLGLINWADRLKIGNALLLLLVLILCLPETDRPALWEGVILAVTLAAWLTARVHVPRALIALGVTTGILLLL